MLWLFVVKLALSVRYTWHFSECKFEIWMLNRADSNRGLGSYKVRVHPLGAYTVDINDPLYLF